LRGWIVVIWLFIVAVWMVGGAFATQFFETDISHPTAMSTSVHIEYYEKPIVDSPVKERLVRPRVTIVVDESSDSRWLDECRMRASAGVCSKTYDCDEPVRQAAFGAERILRSDNGRRWYFERLGPRPCFSWLKAALDFPLCVVGIGLAYFVLLTTLGAGWLWLMLVPTNIWRVWAAPELRSKPQGR
jgi:hypothetical protein